MCFVPFILPYFCGPENWTWALLASALHLPLNVSYIQYHCKRSLFFESSFASWSQVFSQGSPVWFLECWVGWGELFEGRTGENGQEKVIFTPFHVAFPSFCECFKKYSFCFECFLLPGEKGPISSVFPVRDACALPHHSAAQEVLINCWEK